MKYIALVLLMTSPLAADNYYVRVTWDQWDLPLSIRHTHLTFLCEVAQHGNSTNDDEATCMGWIPFESAESIHFLNLASTARWYGFVHGRTRRVYGYNGLWYLVTPDFAFATRNAASDNDCTVHTTLRWRIDRNQN